MKRYVIACSKDWFFDYTTRQEFTSPKFVFLRTKDELCPEHLASINPRYVFFPHWSWSVPAEIHEQYECVCFHTAPLPFGRGGSPIQNLIARGIDESPVCALRMTDEIDAGPVYLSQTISLLGNADEIFMRLATTVRQLITEIVAREPTPTIQVGKPTQFKRRAPDESALPQSGTLESIFNHIRMLDGQGYPPGFIEHGNFTVEFRNAALRCDRVEAIVSIKVNDDHPD